MNNEISDADLATIRELEKRVGIYSSARDDSSPLARLISVVHVLAFLTLPKQP